VITPREADVVVVSECTAIRPQLASAHQFSTFLEAGFRAALASSLPAS